MDSQTLIYKTIDEHRIEALKWDIRNSLKSNWDYIDLDKARKYINQRLSIKIGRDVSYTSFKGIWEELYLEFED